LLISRTPRTHGDDIDHDGSDANFYRAKITTARFYFQRSLPRTHGHAAAAASGAQILMALDADAFEF